MNKSVTVATKDVDSPGMRPRKHSQASSTRKANRISELAGMKQRIPI